MPRRLYKPNIFGIDFYSKEVMTFIDCRDLVEEIQASPLLVLVNGLGMKLTLIRRIRRMVPVVAVLCHSPSWRGALVPTECVLPAPSAPGPFQPACLLLGRLTCIIAYSCRKPMAYFCSHFVPTVFCCPFFFLT